MKNSKKTTVTALFIALSVSVFTSCKDKSSDPEPSSSTKTLNKSLLENKIWYNKGNTNSHNIKTGGLYGTNGTWEWKNNSDTMIIDLDGTGSANTPEEWKFFWSSEHEMACKRASSSSSEILYKDQIW